MVYFAYQSDWGKLFKLSPSGFSEDELLLYADIIPLSIQQQLTSMPVGCKIPFLKFRRLIIDAVNPVLNIVYPFNSQSPQHLETIYHLQANPRVAGWAVIGEEWNEC